MIDQHSCVLTVQIQASAHHPYLSSFKTNSVGSRGVNHLMLVQPIQASLLSLASVTVSQDMDTHSSTTGTQGSGVCTIKQL